MLSFPDRERIASEPDVRVSERATDEERCTSVGRACLGLLGTSTSLASLLEAIPRLLADGLGLAAYVDLDIHRRHVTLPASVSVSGRLAGYQTEAVERQPGRPNRTGPAHRRVEADEDTWVADLVHAVHVEIPGNGEVLLPEAV